MSAGRSVYIGTSAFAASVLEGLVEQVERPQLVITRPPRPAGRGRRLAPTPVALAAERLELELLAPERLADAEQLLAERAPALICLCAYGALVREPLLSRHEILGVHPSLLPRWRGAAPIERALIAGDSETGVSLMRLVAALDEGPVCAVGRVAIGEEDDYGALAARLAKLAVALLAGAYEGPREYVEQPPDGASYAEKITAAERQLDPARPAVELVRVVRALHPHIVARTPDGLRVLEARASSEQVAPGTLRTLAGRLHYGASPGSLELRRVQPPGGRAMDGAAYARGHSH